MSKVVVEPHRKVNMDFWFLGSSGDVFGVYKEYFRTGKGNDF